MLLSTSGEAARGVLSSPEPAGQVGGGVAGKARVLALAFRGQREVWPGWGLGVLHTAGEAPDLRGLEVAFEVTLPSPR